MTYSDRNVGVLYVCVYIYIRVYTYIEIGVYLYISRSDSSLSFLNRYFTDYLGQTI